MVNLEQIRSNLPTNYKQPKVVSVLSGGLDSSIMTMLLAYHYGARHVHAISFDYNQKQAYELEMARKLCHFLEIHHDVFEIPVLGQIAQGVSANIKGTSLDMPSIHEILGDPQPETYVPFRNTILLSLALSYAEALGACCIFTGVQATDQYGYWDTTQTFIDSMNAIAAQNRTHEVQIVAPWAKLSKYEEIEICKEMGGTYKMALGYTLTCYDPDINGRSCGKCPSCAERIAAFKKAKMKDPIDYQIKVDWDV